MLSSYQTQDLSVTPPITAMRFAIGDTPHAIVVEQPRVLVGIFTGLVGLVSMRRFWLNVGQLPLSSTSSSFLNAK